MLAILIVFGFRVPQEGTRHSLGYGYTIDELSFCSYLSRINQCAKPYISDQTQCKAALAQPDVCIVAVDKWLADFNAKCKHDMGEFNNCLSAAKSEEEEKAKCREKMEKLLACEMEVDRAEWMPLPDIQNGVRRKFFGKPSKRR